jgi:hypothetical protein
VQKVRRVIEFVAWIDDKLSHSFESCPLYP